MTRTLPKTSDHHHQVHRKTNTEQVSLGKGNDKSGPGSFNQNAAKLHPVPLSEKGKTNATNDLFLKACDVVGALGWKRVSRVETRLHGSRVGAQGFRSADP